MARNFRVERKLNVLEILYIFTYSSKSVQEFGFSTEAMHFYLCKWIFVTVPVQMSVLHFGPCATKNLVY